MKFSLGRRSLLSAGLKTFAAGSLYGTLGALQRVLAASDTSGYRALVCVFLYGGNDGFNWLVRRDTTGYAEYAAARGTLALSQESLLPITPLDTGGAQYGLHAACTPLQAVFESGRAAFVGNVGSLLRPVTVAQVRARTAELPPHLYSHSDQQAQWMCAGPGGAHPRGWGGRVADLLHSQAHNPQLSINLSLNGSNLWQSGGVTFPYTLGLDDAPELLPITDRSYLGGGRSDLLLALQQQASASAHPMVREYSVRQRRSVELSQVVNGALDAVGSLGTVFPESAIGRQLRLAARMISTHNRVGASRQMYFVGMGGWDTHDDQLATQARLLGELSAGLGAFQSAMDELGEQHNVTAFTASDFGRTLTSNGDGSDHGWGGHALVMGGAVQGRRIYGAMPTLALNGPNDAGWGRIVPTTATDQYAATLARWFGVSDSDLPLLFPNLDRFASRDLGFMA